jgi:uncharacterized protein (TIGR02271 family)
MTEYRNSAGGTVDPRDGRREQTEVIPLVEEHLSVGKREVERARVRVHVQVNQREELVRQELARDDVTIERVPQNVRLTDIPQMRTEGTTTIIPIVEEVLVTEKMLVLVEEIHIHRRLTTETHEIPVMLRSEHAEVQRDAARGEPHITGKD